MDDAAHRRGFTSFCLELFRVEGRIGGSSGHERYLYGFYPLLLFDVIYSFNLLCVSGTHFMAAPDDETLIEKGRPGMGF